MIMFFFNDQVGYFFIDQSKGKLESALRYIA